MRSIGALFFYLTAVLFLLSFFQQGLLLKAIERIIYGLFGWGVIFLPALSILAGNMLLKSDWRLSRPTLLLGGIIVLISSISLSQSGLFGEELWTSISTLISSLGAFLLFFIGLLIGLLVMWELSFLDLIRPFKWLFFVFSRLFTQTSEDSSDLPLLEQKLATEKVNWDKENNLQTKATVNKNQKETEETPNVPLKPLGDFQLPVPGAAPMVWKLPPISLLSSLDKQKADRGDVKGNAQIIEDTLQSFGVQAKVVDYNPGPSVTQYAIRLNTGTKLTKVTSLSNDLALALAARTGQIRIEAPIPGRSLVGIEVPNIASALVSLKELLSADDMKKNKAKLLVGLGLDVSGNFVVMDIAKTPHLLIAGQTGSGKSVCINVFLMSILFRASPAEVKLILVDPKRVELSAYNGIPHLLTPVIIEPAKVVSALRWAINEMEHRYKLLAEVGARNIDAYNELSGFQAMPYIVIVVDELADVMLFAASEVEDCINRLAQMARAVGIHLVLATQRPSVDVITGLIKANIPARIAFNVSSMMDSRVILDTPGAEKLLGRGDMLFLPPDQAKPKRIQGALVTDQDIRNLIDYVKSCGVPVQYTEEVTTKYKSGKLKGQMTMDMEADGDIDDLFIDSVRIVCQFDKASASLLQRKLKIGYNRAARILDQLHTAGVIAPPDGSKPREVLIKNAEEFLAKHQQD